MEKLHLNQKGFTLLEWVIASLIFFSLMGITGIGLTRLQSRTSIDAALDVLVSDIKRQQLKSMTLNKAGETDTNKYGIRVEPDRYYLFKGDSAFSDLQSKEVKLDSNLVFENILFPDWKVIFLKGSGEVENFSAGADNITLKDKYSDQKRTLNINKFGVIEEVTKQ